MELAIIHKGEINTIANDLESFDLSKSFARMEILELIVFEIRRLQDYGRGG